MSTMAEVPFINTDPHVNFDHIDGLYVSLCFSTIMVSPSSQIRK